VTVNAIDWQTEEFEKYPPHLRAVAYPRQLASRARRRVRPERTVPDVDLEAQREVVEAFLGAARDGDFDRLVAVLDPDVVVRADFGPGRWQEVRGAEAVARQALG
jgi:RNA polymerase sigma-70 factor, ECF subfamily